MVENKEFDETKGPEHSHDEIDVKNVPVKKIEAAKSKAEKAPAKKAVKPTKPVLKKGDVESGGGILHKGGVVERVDISADFPKSDFDKYGLIARDGLRGDMLRAGLIDDAATYNELKTGLVNFDRNQKTLTLKYGDAETERRGMDNQIILD